MMALLDGCAVSNNKEQNSQVVDGRIAFVAVRVVV
jgi:hypothetical protein